MTAASEAAGALPAPPRLSVLFAAQAPKAVILRRGPRRHFNLIAWDLSNDRFEQGQWMKGIVRLYDLSPSGDKLIYWAAQLHSSAAWQRANGPGAYDPLAKGAPRPKPGRKVPRSLRQGAGVRRGRPREVTGTWTAVSTPPYFTALAIWPALGFWTGGGGFISERSLFLYESDDGLAPIARVPLPRDLRVAPASAARIGLAPRRSASAPLYGPDEAHAGVWQALSEGGLALDWIHPMAGDLLFAGGGRVYRLARWEEVAPRDYRAAAQLLADVAGDSFRLLGAPRGAMQW